MEGREETSIFGLVVIMYTIFTGLKSSDRCQPYTAAIAVIISNAEKII